MPSVSWFDMPSAKVPRELTRIEALIALAEADLERFRAHLGSGQLDCLRTWLAGLYAARHRLLCAIATSVGLIPAVGSPDRCPALGRADGADPSGVTEAGIIQPN